MQVNRGTRQTGEVIPAVPPETPDVIPIGGAGVGQVGGTGSTGGTGSGSGSGTGSGSGGAELPIQVGELVKHYTFDSRGRIIQTRSQVFDADGNPQAARFRVESFYYDGTRRIQDRIGIQEPGVDPAAVTFDLDREYAWGPGDGIAGEAELLAEYEGDTEASERAWYPLQDAAGDVVCLIEPLEAAPPPDGGGGGGGGSGGGGQGPGQPLLAGRVAANWTFNAYGECLTAEIYASIPDRRVGHKGFFIDRLDSRVTWASGGGGGGSGGGSGGGGSGASLFEPPRVIPFAHHVCHAGNRAYMPQLGRWLQADPNATGLLVLGAAAGRGGEIGAIAAAAMTGQAQATVFHSTDGRPAPAHLYRSALESTTAARYRSENSESHERANPWGGHILMQFINRELGRQRLRVSVRVVEQFVRDRVLHGKRQVRQWQERARDASIFGCKLPEAGPIPGGLEHSAFQ